MPESGKCASCGIYSQLERVLLQVKGRIVFDAECCRRCAFLKEEAVKEVRP